MIVQPTISGCNVAQGGCWRDLEQSWHREKEDQAVERLRICLHCLSGGRPQDQCLKGQGKKLSFTTFNEKHFSLLPCPGTVFTEMSASNSFSLLLLLGLLGLLKSREVHFSWRKQQTPAKLGETTIKIRRVKEKKRKSCFPGKV